MPVFEKQKVKMSKMAAEHPFLAFRCFVFQRNHVDRWEARVSQRRSSGDRAEIRATEKRLWQEAAHRWCGKGLEDGFKSLNIQMCAAHIRVSHGVIMQKFIGKEKL